jgi:ribosomal protein S18 acetylase RimI-like enzyme
MTITRHVFRGEADMPHILDLVRSMPLACRHVIDLPWRLSTPIINEGRDAAFWEDADGQVVGFAAWQYYWAALDFFILAGPERQAVETALFAWADRRFRERDEESGQPLPYWIELRDDDQERQQLAEAHSFLLDESDCYVTMQHALVDLAPVPALPDGFMLRPLKGEQEAEAYAELHRAAFESTSMTPAWRARTIRMPQYQLELDLVVSAPDGSLASFCVGWCELAHRVAQIEPIGVHPHFQRLGIGRVLLLEMLRRFRGHGASSAIIEPSASNIPVRRACELVGFQQVHTIHRKGKWVNQPIERNRSASLKG